MLGKLLRPLRRYINSIRLERLRKRHKKEIRDFHNRIDQWGLTVRDDKVKAYMDSDVIQLEAIDDSQQTYSRIIWEHKRQISALEVN